MRSTFGIGKGRTINPKKVSSLRKEFIENLVAYNAREKDIVHKLCELIGKTKTAKLLGIDRKSLYNKYFDDRFRLMLKKRLKTKNP